MLTSNLKRHHEGIGTLESTDERLAQSEEDKANTPLAFFKELYRQPAPLVMADYPSVTSQLTEITLTPDEVVYELATLNKFKGAGLDGIHPAILKPLAEILQGPLSKLFQVSLGNSSIPGD
ncbi:unnamed protein product [Echinostoma caproni]|uniref:Reverse transcriptase domain-containing protein n=1 Tax=Echinostoma caproni TaxID=27848 RepID=A0A183B5S5_9TREM|nr:unnamed protein product [Echinostoma caproni]